MIIFDLKYIKILDWSSLTKLKELFSHCTVSLSSSTAATTLKQPFVSGCVVLKNTAAEKKAKILNMLRS